MSPFHAARPAGEPGRPTWLITFTDVVALLLAFFVMLFATQRVERLKWDALIAALSRSSTPDSTERAAPRAEATIGSVQEAPAVDLTYLEALLREEIAADKALANARIKRYEDRIVVSLPSELLFAAGSAVPTEAARTVLFSLSAVLGKIDNRIAVDGHADPRPVRAADGETNWELSIARAIAVARALRRGGYRRDPAALGRAATQYAALPRSLPEDEINALARRVDIVIYQHSWVAE